MPILDIRMSGSPIIQGGKLVGMVTHVVANDLTAGYEIFIENMLDTAAKKTGENDPCLFWNYVL